jgi:SAM-dependent methyltransferase
MADVTPPHDFYYQDPAIVDAYAGHHDLLPGEEALFSTYIGPGKRVLDLGIGAGRTTRFLAPAAKRYVGLDYAERMVRRARERFPDLDLDVGDAADLSRYGDASFDSVVFSFNGLGVLPTDARRRQCLREVARVLPRGGTFVFSLHHSRYLAYVPTYEGAGPLRAAWRTLYATLQTVKQLRARLPSRAFWTGAGYVTDTLQTGSPAVYACRPEDVAREVGAAGFDVEVVDRRASGNHRSALLTAYIYYACRKR